MVNTSTEKIPVRSTPAGAVVSVDCGNAPLYGGVTPTTITVPRAASPCSITLAKEGYVQRRVDFQRQLSRATSANKAAAAPVGVLASVLGYVLASQTSLLNPDQVASDSYAVATAVGDPGEQIRREPRRRVQTGAGRSRRDARSRAYDAGSTALTSSESGFFLISRKSSAIPTQIAESATLNAGQWCDFTYTSTKSTT